MSVDRDDYTKGDGFSMVVDWKAYAYALEQELKHCKNWRDTYKRQFFDERRRANEAEQKIKEKNDQIDIARAEAVRQDNYKMKLLLCHTDQPSIPLEEKHNSERSRT